MKQIQGLGLVMMHMSQKFPDPSLSISDLASMQNCTKEKTGLVLLSRAQER
jgi:hypothetical protein